MKKTLATFALLFGIVGSASAQTVCFGVNCDGGGIGNGDSGDIYADYYTLKAQLRTQQFLSALGFSSDDTLPPNIEECYGICDAKLHAGVAFCKARYMPEGPSDYVSVVAQQNCFEVQDQLHKQCLAPSMWDCHN